MSCAKAPTPVLSPPREFKGTMSLSLPDINDAEASQVRDEKNNLTTVDKLKARIWLMEEELKFSQKVHNHTREESGLAEKRNKVMRKRLAELAPQAKKLKEEYEELEKPIEEDPNVVLQRQEQEGLVQRLKGLIAEVEEKRSEVIEDLADCKQDLAVYNDSDEGGLSGITFRDLQLLRERLEHHRALRAEMEADYANKEEQMHQKLEEDFAHIEAHVHAKLDELHNSEVIMKQADHQDETHRLKNDVARLRLRKKRAEDELNVAKQAEATIARETTTVLSRTKDWQHVTQQCVDGIEEAAVAKEGFAAELNELDKESDKVHYHKLKLEYNAKKDLVAKLIEVGDFYEENKDFAKMRECRLKEGKYRQDLVYLKKDARNARASAVEKEIELDDGELWERVLDPTGSSDEESEEEEAAGEEGEAGAVEAAAGEAEADEAECEEDAAAE